MCTVQQSFKQAMVQHCWLFGSLCGWTWQYKCVCVNFKNASLDLNSTNEIFVGILFCHQNDF